VPRAGLSTAAVVDAALELVDERGLAALSLAAVASRTGVAAPSLYKHVEGLAGLQFLISDRVMADMTERFSAAVLGLSRDEAVARLMHAYRAFVLEYPNRYAALPADPLHEPALVATGTRLFGVFLAVLRGYGLRGAAAVHAVRCLRAMVHGFASLESGGGFGLAESLADTYEQLIRMFLASLPRP
jgi:AcrR family transcriptional regulator